MIQGLYETHLFVENLETSIHFYEQVLGLTSCYFEEERRIAFFWVGKPREAMLGLWEKPKSQIYPQHFAFRCDKDFILNKAVDFLNERNLRPYNFLKDGSHQPMVFAWMPAIAIYFNDPDGHQLEFISVLEGDAQPERGVISYDDWMRTDKNA